MQSSVKVSTLNFAGINLSPFEYYDGSQQLQKLSKIFEQKFALTNIPKDKQAVSGIALMDKKFNRQRYCPLYSKKCGVVKHRLLSKDEFELVWRAIFQVNQRLLEGMKITEDSIQRLFLFDWTVFASILEFVYGEKAKHYSFSAMDAKPYIEFMEKAHNKSFLKKEVKAQKIVEFIKRQNIDVMFVQEMGDILLDKYLPQEYSIKADNQSIIIYKNTAIKQQKNAAFDQKYKTKLNVNTQTNYLLTPTHLLLSSHLTSHSPLHLTQTDTLFSLLSQISKSYPNLQIILGIDANHYLDPHPGFHIFPNNRSQSTTCKKRTQMQSQLHKANIMVEEVKDHIVASGEIEQCRIVDAMGHQGKGLMLPNDGHPYDHFFVVVQVKEEAAKKK